MQEKEDAKKKSTGVGKTMIKTSTKSSAMQRPALTKQNTGSFSKDNKDVKNLNRTKMNS